MNCPMRNILIAMHIKHAGNFDKIYSDIKNKVMIDNVNDILKGVDTSKYITIIDCDYPIKIKCRQNPPIVLERISYEEFRTKRLLQ